MDFLKPILGRVLGGVAAGIASYVYAKWGYTIDNESQAAIVSTMLTIASIVYALVHRVINSKINPVDAARIDVAVRTKETADLHTEEEKSNGSN